MKKITAFFLCAVLIVSCFSGCSKTSAEMTEENITATADIVFTALKEFNTDDLETFVNSSTLSVIMKYAENHEQFRELGRAIFENLTYEITSVDASSGTVTFSVKNKDLKQVATDFTNELLDTYSTMGLLQNLTKDDWLDENLSVLKERIGNAPMMNSPQEITVTVEPNDKNLVFTFDENAENGVSGGALGAIKSAIGV